MKLLVAPDCGLTPIVTAIRKAQQSVHVVIFRADLKEFQKALESAVERGVAVHALIAHTNQGGEKRLRKLEQSLLEGGVTVSRTGDDLLRYHGKMLVVDKHTLFALGFNYTSLDIFSSRSFGVIMRHKAFVQEALKLFEADATRQAYVPGLDTFVVSPENSRAQLTTFLKAARKDLSIYDPKIADGHMVRVLQERAKAGVTVRVLGRVTRRHHQLRVEKLPKLRLHVRAILRDEHALFVGSQSLRPLELDRRREIGVIIRDPSVIKQFRSVYEADWALTGHAEPAEDELEHDETREVHDERRQAVAASK